MKQTKTNLKILIAVTLASLLFVGCTTTHRASKEWEYKTVRLNTSQEDVAAELNAASKGAGSS